MPAFRSLLEELSLLAARTLSLREDAAHVLAPLEFEARRRVKETFAARGIQAPRAAMEVRLAPPAAGGTAEDSRKESVA